MKLVMKVAEQKKHERGFTLIEIMVVVVIIGLLAGLVGPRVFKNLEKGKIATARTQMSQLKTSLATYRLDVGKYPDSINCLVSPCGEGWSGPYLDGDAVPADPWNEDYQYSSSNNGKSFILTSSGGGDEAIIVKG